MTTTAERLQAVRAKIDSARDAVEGDKGASPVLVALVDEVAKKADKAAAFPDGAMGRPDRSRQAGRTLYS